MKNLIKKFWSIKVMTLFVFIVLVFTNKNVYSQIVNIPDVQLKNRLLNHSPEIDLNHNYQIEYSEAAAFTGTLDISGGGSQIINLTGLEAFSGITRLYMGNNSVHNSWSFWGNTALQELHCETNFLTSIDVSQNTNLTLLNCMDNDITNLNLTGNPSLTALYCDGNQLTSLTLYLNSNLSILYCSENPLTNLDLSLNTNLTTLYCTSNPSLPGLDLSANTNLTELDCSANLFDSLNISANTNLITLNCSNNHLKKLDISHNEFLVSLNCSYNQMSSLIFGPNWSLKYLICHHNELRNLKTSFCTALVSLYCQNNSIYELDLHNNRYLQVLYAPNNQLRYLNIKNDSNTNISNSNFQVYANDNLTCIQVDNPVWANSNWFNKPSGASYSLSCPNCIVNIPSINFKYTLLMDSSINFNWDNEIQCYEAAEYTGEIDVSWKQINNLTGIEAFTSIYSLKCNVNDLTSLNLAANTSLTYLNCSSNPITNLNVSGNSLLTSFNCEYNNLTSLNVKNGNNVNFIYFNAKNSPNLSCIQVDDVAWSTLHWTVGNGNIDPGVQFNVNCACAQFSTSASVISDVMCNGGSDGSASATPIGGTPPYLFLWSNGETSQTIIDLEEGTYSVNVVDNNNCAAGNSVTILQPELLTVSASGTNVSCYGGSDGSATAVVAGGIPPYEFLWNNNNSTQDILNLASGVFEVSVTDANGCEKTDLVSIGQPPLLVSNTSISICNTDSVYLQHAWRKISGIYLDTLLSVNGCDSIIVTNLTVMNFAAIHGSVTYSGGFIGNGDARVNLFRAGIIGHHHLADSVSIDSIGSFAFQNIPDGNYYLHVKLNDNNFPYQYVHDSYFDSTYKWQDAQVLSLSCGMDTNIQIHIFETGPQNTGSGHLSGSVHFITPGSKTVTDPINGAGIFIELEPDNNLVGNCLTDTSGFFEFSGLSIGSYSLYIDIPGFPLIQTYTGILVTLTDTSFANLNFYVDTTIGSAGIYTSDIVVSVTNLETSDLIINLYPNPVKKELSIEAINQKEKLQIEILSINGQLLYKSIIDKKGIIDMSLFSPSTYFLKIQSKKSIIIKKIIKQ